MSKNPEQTSNDILKPLMRDFVDGSLDDEDLRAEIRDRIKCDRELAMVYAKEVRMALDEGRVETPVVPKRAIPESVVNVLESEAVENSKVSEAGAGPTILAALERALTAGDSVISHFGDRLQKWIAVASTGGFELAPVLVRDRRGNSVRVRLKHLSESGIMAVVDLPTGADSVHVVVRPAYLDKFMIMLVPLEPESPPLFEEVNGETGKAEIEFSGLKSGSYVVSIEPSQ